MRKISQRSEKRMAVLLAVLMAVLSPVSVLAANPIVTEVKDDSNDLDYTFTENTTEDGTSADVQLEIIEKNGNILTEVTMPDGTVIFPEAREGQDGFKQWSDSAEKNVVHYEATENGAVKFKLKYNVPILPPVQEEPIPETQSQPESQSDFQSEPQESEVQVPEEENLISRVVDTIFPVMEVQAAEPNSTMEERVMEVSYEVTSIGKAEIMAENETIVGAAGAAVEGAQTFSRNASLSDLTISNPRLEVETLPGEEADYTVASHSVKGYFARISANTPDNSGVTGVWLGYRFTVNVPEGVGNDWVRFTQNSYDWLRKLSDGTSKASPVWNGTTRTWTLEGKYQYNESDPLGSSAAKEFAKSISITVGWIDNNVTIEPTIETWLVDKEGDSPQKNNGDSITVKNSPMLQSYVSGLKNVMVGLYSPSKKKFYYKKSEAEAEGANDAMPGRVYAFQAGDYTMVTPGNEMIKNNQPAVMHIPLSVTVNNEAENNPDLQPILLAAHYDAPSESGKNAYAQGMISDLTYDGRVEDYLTTDSIYKDISMSSVSYADNTITATVSATNANAEFSGVERVNGYYQIFVPVADTDTESTNRTLKVGSITADPVKHTSGTETAEITYTGKDLIIKVDPVNDDIVDFKGAYSREFRFGYNSPTAVAVGADDGKTSIFTTIVNVKSEINYEIKAFDMLIKLDTDAYKVDSSVDTVSTATSDSNAYGSIKYKLKYGVLKNGGNWGSDEVMNNGRKTDLIFYEAGNVPDGAEVAAILIEGRNGRMNRGATSFILENVKPTNDATKAGRVYQACLDVETWSDGADPDKDSPSAGMYASDGNGYKKASYDADGTYHKDDPEQLNGDSLLFLAYTMTNKNYNLNGRNAISHNNSSYDVTMGERSADVYKEVVITYLGEKENENKEQEIQVRLAVSKMKQNAVVEAESIRLSTPDNPVSYQPGKTSGASGVIQGGTAPEKIEDTNPGADSGSYYVYFTVKGSGTYQIYYTVQLGDEFTPEKEVATGSIIYDSLVGPVGSSALMLTTAPGDSNIFVIEKSAIAGFKKTSVSKVSSADGTATYRMVFSAQNQDITGTQMLDVFPFNGDGRGTNFSGSYVVGGPLKLTLNTVNTTIQSDINVYYTTDTAIRRSPLPMVEEVKDINFAGASVDALGVTWTKAERTGSDKNYFYALDVNTTAIISSGKVGRSESPIMDLSFKLSGMKSGDTLTNSAGLNADQFGEPMYSGNSGITISERQITGRAWVDANHNGRRDTDEAGLEGVTVKLYQGDSEIIKDENGIPYDVVTGEDGSYIFHNIPSSPERFYVVFSGKNLENYIASEKKAVDVEEDKNSDVAQLPDTTNSLISDPVFLYTQDQQADNGISLDSKQLDAGLVPYRSITFDPNGGDKTPATQRVPAGGKVTAPEEPSRTGYTLDGWSYSDDGTEKKWDYSENIVERDMTLTANWKKKTYKVDFAVENGERGGELAGNTEQQSVPYEEYAGRGAGVKVNTGSAFLGWSYTYTPEGETAPVSGTIFDYTRVPITGDVTFVAQFAKIPFVSGISTNGFISVQKGGAPADAGRDSVTKIEYDTTETLPAEAGFRFKGRPHYHIAGISLEDLSGHTFSVALDKKDGQKFVVGDTADDTAEITVTADKAGGTLHISGIEDSLKFAFTFEEDAKYTVSFKEETDSDAVWSQNTGLYTGDAMGTAPAEDPAKQGYTFGGWSSDGSSSQDKMYNPEALITDKNEVYYAVWIPKEYTVHYNTAGGTAVADKTGVHYTDKGLVPEVTPMKPGYTFAGWTSDGRPVTAKTRYSDLAADDSQMEIILEAQWQKKEYTATWRTKDGETLGSIEGGSQTEDGIAYEEYATKDIKAVPASEDSELLGWEYTYTPEGSTEPATGFTEDYKQVKVLGDITFTAKFAEKVFVSIGTANGKVTAAKGTQAEEISGDSGTSALVRYTAEDLKDEKGAVTLKYAADIHYHLSTITFRDTLGHQYTILAKDGSTVTEGPDYEVGVQELLSRVTVKVNETEGTISITGIDTSLAFMVMFEPDPTYKVEFYTEQNEPFSLVQVNDGLYTGNPVGDKPKTDPVKEGYTFKGWSTDGTDTPDKLYSKDTKIKDADIAYYAIWVKNESKPTENPPSKPSQGSNHRPAVKGENTISGSTKPVKTGDSTNIMLFIVLLVGASAALTGVVAIRRRRKR